MSKPIYVTTQRTGKGLKAASIASLAAIFGSLLMISQNPDTAAWLFVLGIVALITTRALIWWNHA